jgi:hypothetical protein
MYIPKKLQFVEFLLLSSILKSQFSKLSTLEMTLEARFTELGIAHKLSPDQVLVLAAAGLGLKQEVCLISQHALNTLLLSDFFSK